MRARRSFRPAAWDALEERVVLSKGISPFLNPFGLIGAIASAVQPNKAAAPAATVGTLGDSYTDEYKFYPPNQSHARNWVEILANTRNVSFGSYSNASRGAPRNQGFAYNWAQDGATSTDMVNNQLPGLTKQVAAGVVQCAWIFVGDNDFLYLLGNLQSGQISEADFPQALAQTEATAQANFNTAVNTLLAANPRVKLAVSTLPDVSLLPLVQAGATTPALKAAVAATSQAIQQFNANVTSVAAGNNRIALVDLAGLSSQLGQTATGSGGSVSFGGATISLTTPGNDYHDFFLADGLHVGTVGQGLIADAFVNAIDTKFGAKVRTLSPTEIVRYAKTVQNQTKHGPGPR
ncbi:MAG: SGNH/GDSL hydrolase family protein [Isosphaeraceae bacterium]|nr:SGNH/GDSL hydrolase family protein [Isosphaeraceae bacterium]